MWITDYTPGFINLATPPDLVRAIDADGAMTGEQKRLVRALVDEWAERDEGVGG